MAEVTDTASSSKSVPKKTRKAITVKMKLDIIQRYENGDSITNIAKSYGLNRSTIGTIIKGKHKIRKYVAKDLSLVKPSSIRTRLDRKKNPVAERMEELLVVWMTQENLWEDPMDRILIQQKAMSIYSTLKEAYSADNLPDFKASVGWFKRFRHRYNNLILSKPTNEKPERMNTKKVLNSLSTTIEENEYSAKQVFYVDEIVLLWKSIPIEYTSMPFVKRIQNFQDTITLLFATNAEADSNITPLFIHNEENPPELRSVTKSSLPLIWGSSADGMITIEIFKEWFFKNFILETKLYCELNKIPFKILLLLRSSSVHPVNLDDFHPDVRVIMVPSSITTTAIPMRGVFKEIFSNLYIRRLLTNILESLEREKPTKIEEFWKSYNIYSCLKNVKYCWDEMRSTYKDLMNAAWEKTHAPFVKNIVDCQAVADAIIQDVINTHNYLENLIFQKRESDEPISENETKMDVEELVLFKIKEECVEEQTINEEQTLSEKHSILVAERQNVQHSIDTNPIVLERKFDKTKMARVFQKIDDALGILESMDPNCSRFAQAAKCISDAILPYRKIYRDENRWIE